MASDPKVPFTPYQTKKHPITDDYDLGDILGTGTFSEVRLCTNKKTGEKFAVKVMTKEEHNPRKKEIIDVEIEILKRVDHPHVVNLFDLYETETEYFLVLQLITGGELFDRIVELVHYSEKDASEIVKKIVLGVQHLHSKQIVHRDLKPENLLLSSKDPDANVLITDFGLSAILPEGERLYRAVGTPGYLAPEVLETLDTGEGYTQEVDLWGIGVIMYILLCGFPPFYGEDDDEIYDKICEGYFEYPSPYWDDISEEAKDLIDKLLVLNPAKRFTSEQVLSHKWITDNTRTDALGSTIAELKKFNARRKLRKGIFSVIAAQKLAKSFKVPVPSRPNPRSFSKSVATSARAVLEMAP
jgi:calcium/calmodulin-dependent protein kinase I